MKVSCVMKITIHIPIQSQILNKTVTFGTKFAFMFGLKNVMRLIFILPVAFRYRIKVESND